MNERMKYLMDLLHNLILVKNIILKEQKNHTNIYYLYKVYAYDKGCFTIRVHLQKIHGSPVLTVEAYFDFRVLLPKH